MINLKEFPTTRYQGSKRKILPWIHDIVNELEFDTVLDACGGSASVSYLFKKMGKAVTYNDKLKFNYFIGKALIENQMVKFSPDDLNTLLHGNHTPSNFIQNNFRNIYYLNSENRWLDTISSGVHNMNHYVGDELEFKKSIAFYALFQASLIKRPFNLFHRKNLDIRTNDVDRNFGNKVTWEKTFNKHFKQFIKEANSLIFDSGRPCQAINQSIFQIENPQFDLVYLDPPYLTKEGTNETSNYLKCYHFLEGLANYDNWHNLIDTETINHRFKNIEEENDFKKNSIYKSFDLLLEKYRNSIIVLSYKKGGLPGIEYLVKTMKRHKQRVYTRSQHYKYALNRQNGNEKKNREFLIIGV